MIRNPVVAGQFYSASKSALSKEVASLLEKTLKPEDALGVVSPHAGYVYSGSVAGSVFSSIKPKSTYVIMGPNHTGLGEAFGMSDCEIWSTPLGEIKVDKALADKILKTSRHVRKDGLSHAHEHSVEVQIPFLQSLQKDFTIVPMVISYAPVDIYIEVGKAIAGAVKDLKLEKDVMIIASSDMTHYESQESVKRKDSAAIEAILELDEKKLFARVSELDISMCGYAPVIIMIAAVKELGAKSARLVKYQTSGDVSGDYSAVVGYAGIVITK